MARPKRPHRARRQANLVVLIDVVVVAIVLLVVQFFVLQSDETRTLGSHKLILTASGRPGSILATLTLTTGDDSTIPVDVEFSTRSGQRVAAHANLPGRPGVAVVLSALLADVPGDGEIMAAVRLRPAPLRWRPVAQLMRATEVELSAAVQAAGP